VRVPEGFHLGLFWHHSYGSILTRLLLVLLQLPMLPVPEHSRYRWLVSLDGFTASFRFGQLLHTNSVVLKMRSPWIEYYYRWGGGDSAQLMSLGWLPRIKLNRVLLQVWDGLGTSRLRTKSTRSLQ
jgi:hypothetical protein